MSVANGNGSFSAEQADEFKSRNRDFPLRWHPRGGWCKKIRGSVYYFGRVTPDEALTKYEHDRDYLKRGEAPPAYDPQAVTIRELANEFLAAKETRVDSGELSGRSWADYKRTCGYIVSFFGANRAVANLQPADFVGFRAKLAKGRGLVGLLNEVNRCRCIFKFAFDSGLIDRPIRYGENFRRPDKGSLRKVRNAIGRQDFQPAEVRQILDSTSGQLHAMVLLGVNTGIGTADCGRLDIEMLDLKHGWMTYHRPKTGAYRRAPLWIETVKALWGIVGQRREGFVFQTAFLNSWTTTAINHELGKVLKQLALVKRQRSFYGLRRTFRTIAAECKDASACNIIMGHTDDKTMGDLYVQDVSDERLRAVSEHVRNRLSTWHGWIKRVC